MVHEELSWLDMASQCCNTFCAPPPLLHIKRYLQIARRRIKQRRARHGSRRLSGVPPSELAQPPRPLSKSPRALHSEVLITRRHPRKVESATQSIYYEKFLHLLVQISPFSDSTILRRSPCIRIDRRGLAISAALRRRDVKAQNVVLYVYFIPTPLGAQADRYW